MYLNQWIKLSLVALTTIGFLSALCSLWLYLVFRKKYIFIWFLSWAFNGFRYLVELNTPFISTDISQYIDLFMMISSLLFWVGFVTFIKSKNRYKIYGPYFLVGASLLWGALLRYFLHKPSLASVPVFLTSGLLVILAGWDVFRKKYQLDHFTIANPLGVTLILWGIHRIDFAFLRYNVKFAPYGYHIGSILTAFVSIFLFVLAIEKEKYEKDTSITRYKLIFENSRDIMILVDNNNKIVEVNNAAETLYGFSRNDLCGNSIYTVKAASNLNSSIGFYGGELYETIHVKKDGSSFPVEVSSQTINIDDEKLTLAIIRDITERKANEAKIIKSQEFYLSLFEQVPLLMWQASPNGQINYVNQSWLDFTGKTKEEEFGFNWITGIHPEDRLKYEAEYLKALRSKVPFELAYRFKCFDGNYRWIINKGRPFNDLEGNYAGYIGTCFDVTSERESREKISKLQENLFITLKSISEVVIATDVEGRITFINPAAEKMIGQKEKDVVSKSMTEVVLLFFEDDSKFSVSVGEEIDPNEVVINQELYLKNAAGDICPVAYSANLIKKEDGSLEGRVVVLRDLTKEKEAAYELKASEARYRLTFENIGAGLMIFGEDTIVELVNKGMEQLLGYSKKDLEGKVSWTQFIKLQDVEKMLKYKTQLFRNENPPKSFEFTLIDASQREHYILCNVECLPGGKKAIASWIDITEQKKAEKRISYLSYHDHLTGLYNRARCEDELKRLDIPDNLPFSVIMGDVNGLKLVNDAFGHEKGDSLLKDIANILSTVTREDDVLARWGGDEFIILMPRTSQDEAEKVLSSVQEICATQESEANLIQASISLGLGVKTNSEQDLNEIISQAESYMYSQKLQDTHEFKAKVFAILEERLLEKNMETKHHVLKVKKLSERLGKAIGLTKTQLEELTMAAALHDIGKVGLEKSLWTRDEKLTPGELEKIKKHPLVGYQIMKIYPQLSGVAEAILAHHERWDGKGFPQGLKKTEIPLMARIIASADAFYAMTNLDGKLTSEKVKEALQKLEAGKNTEFDPELVEAFIATFNKKKSK